MSKLTEAFQNFIDIYESEKYRLRHDSVALNELMREYSEIKRAMEG